MITFPLTQCYISPLENSDQISTDLMLTFSFVTYWCITEKYQTMCGGMLKNIKNYFDTFMFVIK